MACGWWIKCIWCIPWIHFQYFYPQFDFIKYKGWTLWQIISQKNYSQFLVLFYPLIKEISGSTLCMCLSTFHQFLLLSSKGRKVSVCINNCLLSFFLEPPFQYLHSILRVPSGVKSTMVVSLQRFAPSGNHTSPWSYLCVVPSSWIWTVPETHSIMRWLLHDSPK